ncbi:hypothetical protein ACFQY7_33985 [Actinomadura luteofluorescens]|uniref:hypothetical protein n=1 Tax=Actinomadura luteofluorescens TaxID=46163 RepID=UPI003631DFD4
MAFADKYVSPSVVGFLEQMIRETPIDVIAEYYPALMAHDKIGCLDVLGGVPMLVLAGGRDRLTPRSTPAGSPRRCRTRNWSRWRRPGTCCRWSTRAW